MTMQAYTNRFEYLARFYSQAIIEEWRCRKFEGIPRTFEDPRIPYLGGTGKDNGTTRD